jgi:hypothetical protein
MNRIPLDRGFALLKFARCHSCSSTPRHFGGGRFKPGFAKHLSGVNHVKIGFPAFLGVTIVEHSPVMRILPRFFLFCSLFVFFASAALFAQAPRNLISNPGFESARNTPNPWYGTGPDGTIESIRGQVPVLTERGSIANTAMPVSVALGDLNNDGKLDLLIGGVTGYMHVFFNEGTPDAPKFGRGELIPVFLTRLRAANDDHGNTWFRYMAQRLHLGDIARSGKLDIWIGNYSGEVLRLPNAGSGASPDFRQPQDVSRLLIPTTQDPTRRWGNVFAPALWDVDGDGRTDLLIGEGSYSANSIHVLLNQGSNAAPRFLDENRHFLAYGMGREQLTPAVVDFNGNGQPDLLVADRSGRIGLYSSTITPTDAEAKADNLMATGAGGRAAQAGRWKTGEHIPFVSYLTTKAGQEIRFPGIPTIAVGDLTGNGAFDIVVGTSNGRVSWIKNTGTPAEPKFEAPVVLKGEPTPAVQAPSGWNINIGDLRGNFLGYASVVDNTSDPNLNPPEGSKALKLGYMPNINKIIRTTFAWPGSIGPRQDREGINADWRAPANIFEITRDVQLEVNKDYVLTFQMRGSGVLRASGSFNGTRNLVVEEGRVEQLGRGGVRRVGREEVRENLENTIRLSAAASWSNVTTNITTKFKDRRLNDPDERGRVPRVPMKLTLTFELTPGSGTVYLDNFSLMEK